MLVRVGGSAGEVSCGVGEVHAFDRVRFRGIQKFNSLHQESRMSWAVGEVQ